uniref:Uncharacterized protein n=1 Tax=Panagrolaimus sp. ES5 TaxID=591445 RepID=A0AC34FH10_9BILA
MKMDLTDSQATTLTSNRERKTEDSSMIVPSKKARFMATYRHQSFSLPDSIMHYMAMNPKNAEVYQKLVKSCKYFFVKNPILVLSDLRYDSNGWETLMNNGWKDIVTNNISSKLWITDTFDVSPDLENENDIASSIIPKIYQCNVKELSLWDQIISYDEFMVLASAVEDLNFDEGTVKYDDGTVVPLEKLVEKLLNVKQIESSLPSDPSALTFSTFKELLKIPHFVTLDEFRIWNMPETFDVETFYTYMKKNKHTKILLHFHHTVSEDYQTRLEAIVDEIIEVKNHEYKIPFICFDGLDQEKDEKLKTLYHQK